MHTLPIVSTARDLGITVTSNLSPFAHVGLCDIVSRAHNRASANSPLFLSRDVGLLVRAFKVYVGPLIGHNSVIWSPNTLQNIDAIECVLRRFTKRSRGLGYMIILTRHV